MTAEFDEKKTAKFLNIQSCADLGFWSTFRDLKINELKLNSEPVPIFGTVTHGQVRKGTTLPCRLFVDGNSFSGGKPAKHYYNIPGTLLNMNKVEEFKSLNKQQFLNDMGAQIWTTIKDGSFLEQPNDLFRFVILSFADLKRYNFIYWFGFPTIIPKGMEIVIKSQTLLTDRADMDLIIGNHRTFYADNSSDLCYWVDHDLEFYRLMELKDPSQVLAFCLVDNSAHQVYPGWNLRTYVVAIAHHFGLQDINIWCLRKLESNFTGSQVFSLEVQGATLTDDVKDVKIVGWEKNNNRKLGPRQMDLKAQMDPSEIMAQSVNLNLSLMRWRQLPSLNLETIRNTNCLLLGAGTLGCNVARNLMGWGFGCITFVDNGRVSFSNPARQSLYTFEDCLDGGKFKALAAAERLKQIYPKQETQGVVLTIPMPGHSVPEDHHEQVKNDYLQLEQLIEDHDIIFLLTDSRESRWLPTILAQLKGKLVLNVALGFDTYVVMRHGSHGSKNAEHERLGCYFCTDIVAPRDSLSDRTLDQQCTVTRPGLAPVASALSVELLVGLLHTEERQFHEADQSIDFSARTKHRLGLIPHQIRGFITHFQNILMKAPAFDQCPACSTIVLEQLASDGWGFVLNALNNPSYLEELTGLSALYDVDIDIDWDEDGDDF